MDASSGKIIRLRLRPGQPHWRRLRMALAGYDRRLPAPIGGSGLVHLMGRPYRLFDSRPGAVAPFTTGTKLSPSQQEIQVVGTAPVGGRPFVPTGTVGVLATITVTQTESGGYLKAYPTLAAAPDTSVLNWTATNQSVATTTIVSHNVYGNVWTSDSRHCGRDWLRRLTGPRPGSSSCS